MNSSDRVYALGFFSGRIGQSLRLSAITSRRVVMSAAIGEYQHSPAITSNPRERRASYVISQHHQ
ncbi:hypothetical protein WM019_04650 [Bifidobacterium mongoliense]|jgi:hypothetical protein|uniref:hypothetical protein n=1 Tax=Bifidobacterium mongoliense TaxID=518643 RepID=UPI0030EF035C